MYRGNNNLTLTEEEFVKILQAVINLDKILGEGAPVSEYDYPTTPEEVRNEIGFRLKAMGIKTYDGTRLTDNTRRTLEYCGGEMEFGSVHFKFDGTHFYIWAYTDVIKDTNERVLVLGRFYKKDEGKDFDPWSDYVPAELLG